MINEPKAILFDLGNVLFDLDIPKTWRALEELLAVKFDHPFAYPPTAEVMYAYEKGEVDTGTFVGEIQRLSLPGTSPEQIVQAWNAMMLKMPAHRFDFLEKLKKRFPLYLLSNINSLHLEFFYRHLREEHKIKNWDTAYFQQTFYSNFIGCRKPDKEAYELVLAEMGFDPSEILFIDDNVHNIEGAKSMGIQAIHISEKMEVAELDFFLDKV